MSLAELVQTFGTVTWAQRGRDLKVTKGPHLLLSLRDVQNIQVELEADAIGNRYVALARVLRAKGRTQVFFIDFDERQSNVRKVHCSLTSLDETRAWLLPPGYLYRQGDVGLYARQRIPSVTLEIPYAQQPSAFAHLLNRRHRFDPIRNCRFYKGSSAHIVAVAVETMMLHPEHSPITLPPGLYMLRGARGKALGREIPIRSGKPPLVIY